MNPIPNKLCPMAFNQAKYMDGLRLGCLCSGVNCMWYDEATGSCLGARPVTAVVKAPPAPKTTTRKKAPAKATEA